MLHYKTNKNHLILAYKTKKRLISKEFFWAFLIALTIHALFVLIINIKDFVLMGNFLPTLPIHVESDLSSLYHELGQDTLSLKELKGGVMEPDFYEKNPPYLTIPILPLSEVSQPEFLSFPLSKVYGSTFEHKETFMKKGEVRLIFTGELNEDLHLPFENVGKNFLARFKFQVEGQNGKIFWIEPILSSGSNVIDQKLINILKTLELPNDPLSFVKRGEVEFRSI